MILGQCSIGARVVLHDTVTNEKPPITGRVAGPVTCVFHDDDLSASDLLVPIRLDDPAFVEGRGTVIAVLLVHPNNLTLEANYE